MTIDGRPITRKEADDVLNKLRPREKYIVMMRFPKDPRKERMIFENIGKKVGLDSKAVSYNLYRRAVKRIAFMLDTDIKTAEVFLSLAVPEWNEPTNIVNTITPENGKKMDFIDRCLKTANTYRLSEKDKKLIKHALDWALLKQPDTTEDE